MRYACSLSLSVVSDSLQHFEPGSGPRYFSGKNTGMGPRESNPHRSHLLHWQAGSLPLVRPGKRLVLHSLKNKKQQTLLTCFCFSLVLRHNLCKTADFAQLRIYV